MIIFLRKFKLPFILNGNSNTNSVVITEYGLSNRRFVFELGLVHVVFVRENVTLRRVVLRVLLLSAAASSSPMSQAYLNLQTGEAVVCTSEVMLFWKSESIRGNIIGVNSFEMVEKTQALSEACFRSLILRNV
jgi:hypothetical protein